MTISDDRFRVAYALADRQTPRIRMNFVASADGAATLEDRSGSLGGPGDRALMQVLRAMADVVLVGAGTVRAEGYAGMPEQLAVVSRRLALDPADPVFAEARVRPLLITCAAAPADRRAELAQVAEVIIAGDEEVDLADARDELARRGLPQILCEGGPHLFGSLLDAGLVDEMCLTLAPRLVGGDAGRIVRGAQEHDRRFRLGSVLSDDDGFVYLRYTRP